MANSGYELATGYVSLSVSSSGLGAELSKEFAKVPKVAADAGKKAGTEFSKGFGTDAGKAAAQAADDVKKSQLGVVQSSKAAEDATTKYAAATRKVEIAQKAAAEATAKYGEDSLQALKAIDRLKNAEVAQAKARNDIEAASKRAASATEGLAKAQKDLADASAKAEKALSGVAKESEEAGKKSGKGFTAGFEAAFDKLPQAIKGPMGKLSAGVKKDGDDAGGKFSDGMEGGLKGGLPKLGGVLKAGLVGVAAGAIGLVGKEVLGGLASIGDEFSSLSSSLAVSTGKSGAELERLNTIAKGVGRQLPISFGEAGEAAAAMSASMGDLGKVTDKQLQDATKHAVNFSKAFQVDIGRATQVVGQMMKTGMAKDAVEAFDLMTAAAQKVPPVLREDILDAIDEYGPAFEQAGFSGEAMMGVLVKASEKGMYGIDKTGDAIKELGIRMTTADKNASGALETMGLKMSDLGTKMAKGGDEGRKAFEQIITGLQNVKDPLQRAQLAVDLFGTPLEDLNTSDIPQFLQGLKDGATELDGFGGAAQRMGDNLNSGAGAQIEIFKNQLKELIGPSIAEGVGWLTEQLRKLSEALRGVNGNGEKVEQPQWAKDTIRWFNDFKKQASDFGIWVQGFWMGLTGNLDDTPIAANSSIDMGLTFRKLGNALGDVMDQAKPLFDSFITPDNTGKTNNFAGAVKFLAEETTKLAEGIAAVMKVLNERDPKNDPINYLNSYADSIKNGPAEGSWRSMFFDAGVDTTEGFAEGLESGEAKNKSRWLHPWEVFIREFKRVYGIQSPSTVFSGFGVNVIEGFLNGIEEMGGAGWARVTGWFTGIIDKVKETLGIQSPSTVFAAMAGDVAAGFINGLTDAGPNLFSSVTTWAQGIVTAAVTKLGELAEQGAAKFEELRTQAGTKLGELRADVETKATELKDQAVARFTELREQGVTRFTELKDQATTRATELKDQASTRFTEMRDNLSTRATELKDQVTTRFTELKDQASTRAQELKDTANTRFTEMRDGTNKSAGEMRDWVGTRFTELKDRASTTWSDFWTDTNNTTTDFMGRVERGIDAGLAAIRRFFDNAVKGIGDKWNEMRAATAAPIRWVIDAVINGGIIKGWNDLVGLLKMDNLKIGTINVPGFDRGGVLPGRARSPRGDNLLVVNPKTGQPEATVRSGEGIIPESVTRSYQRAGMLDQVISGQPLHKPLPPPKKLPGFFMGGVMPTTAGAVNPHRLPYYGATWAGDMPRPMGTPIFAWKAGTVASVNRGYTSYGHETNVNHGGQSTKYAHQSVISVNPGQQVRQGERIGSVGTTGNSSGPHLHFEIRGGTLPIGASATGSAQASAGPSLFDVALGWIADKLTAPVRALIDKVPGAGMFTELAKGMGNKLLDHAVEKLKSYIPMSSAGDDSMSGAVAGGSMAANAKLLMAAGKTLGANRNAMHIALMTAAQESSMGTNRTAMTRANSDGDVGWYQQRTTRGDGTIAQLADPLYATRVFLRGVNVPAGYHVPGLYDIRGWESMRKGDAAQRVQVSAFPRAYDKWEDDAEAWLSSNAYLNGGTVPRSSLISLSEDGRPELVVGPQVRHAEAGTRVFNADETETIMGGGGRAVKVIINNPINSPWPDQAYENAGLISELAFR